MKTFVKTVAVIIMLSSCNTNQAQESVSVIENVEAKSQLIAFGNSITESLSVFFSFLITRLIAVIFGLGSGIF